MQEGALQVSTTPIGACLAASVPDASIGGQLALMAVSLCVAGLAVSAMWRIALTGRSARRAELPLLWSGSVRVFACGGSVAAIALGAAVFGGEAIAISGDGGRSVFSAIRSQMPVVLAASVLLLLLESLYVSIVVWRGFHVGRTWASSVGAFAVVVAAIAVDVGSFLPRI